MIKISKTFSATAACVMLSFLGGCAEGIDSVVTEDLPPAPLPPPPAENNNAPTISGVPATAIEVGGLYSFTPTATDQDGDPIQFSVTNRPAWLIFNNTDGSLTGIPASADARTYENIQITVTDGALSASLPEFAIEVVQSAPANNAPVISGSPAPSIVVGNAYLFTPVASDADGNELTFSIENQPSWSSFDSTSGMLGGMPSAGDVGIYANIRITVTDGNLSASLPQFSIAVTQVATGSISLTWTAPTTNTDGSPLTDLAGYRIYYGISQGNYANEIQIDNPGIVSFIVEDLVPNTYYFVSTSINSADVESPFSNVATQTVSP